MPAPISRRRLITIAGAAVAVAGVGLQGRSTAALPLVRWRGAALGAEATILLHHPSRAKAERLIDACRGEIRRLEAQFSLYEPASTLSRLNAGGSVDGPPLDFYRLLTECRRFHAVTGGAFDPSVQPLWRLYADYFGSGGDSAGPTAAAIAQARQRVGFDDIDIAPDTITLRRPGMALTLNGIAQGYITDRVADLLRDHGIGNTLISLGETRAIGRHPDGRSWRVALGESDTSTAAQQFVELDDMAVATSAGAGTPFEPSGRFHHLLDPRTGRPAHCCRSVSVITARATTADAVSTALAVLPVARAADIMRASGAQRAVITLVDGSRHDVAAAGGLL